MSEGLDNLRLYIRSCSICWLGLYCALSFLFAFASNVMLHVMVVGLLICVITFTRLPPPDLSQVKRVLGQDPFDREDGSKVDWEIAHRAACLDAPENSIEAVRLAAESGVRMVEFDVSFTSCMSPVAFHDDTVDRITQASGPVTSFTLGNLQKLDLSAKHPLGSNFPRVTIPLVEDFVKECLRLNIKMIMDLKTYDQCEETAVVVLGLFRKYPAMYDATMVTSFFPHLLYRIRREDPRVICSLSYRPHFFAYESFDGENVNMKPRFSGMKHLFARMADSLFPFLLENFIWYVVGLSAILVHRNIVTKGYVSDWRMKGVRVFAWTVNEPMEKAYFKKILRVQCLTDTLEKVKPEQWLLSD